MTLKLTDTSIRGLPPNTEIRDSQVTGLLARRQTGAVSWLFVHKRGGKVIKKNFGALPRHESSPSQG
jgi:hypothetical protein